MKGMNSMKRIGTTIGGGLLLLLAGMGSTVLGKNTTGTAQDFGSSVEKEVTRLREQLAQPELARSLGPREMGRLGSKLRASEEALAFGASQLGLRHLAQVRLDLGREVFLQNNSTLETIEELRALFAEVTSDRQPLFTPNPNNPRPAALRALLEVSQGRAKRYLGSVMNHGQEAGVGAGLYYLAVARSFSGLTRFVAQLPYSPPKEPVGELPGLESYLQQLELEVIELYQPPLSVSRHRDFTSISAKLKFARQLKDEGALIGALELALDAREGLARFENSEHAMLGSIEASFTEQGARLDAKGRDHSLGRLLHARARAALEALVMEDKGESAAEALVLVESMLPEYFACFSGEEQQELEQEEVTVTLVRWPFT